VTRKVLAVALMPVYIFVLFFALAAALGTLTGDAVHHEGWRAAADFALWAVCAFVGLAASIGFVALEMYLWDNGK
jgi:hypothetical protein